jgi:hypothetical protein
MHSQSVLRVWLAFVLINTISSHDIAATDPIVNLGYARYRGLVDPESLYVHTSHADHDWYD